MIFQDKKFIYLYGKDYNTEMEKSTNLKDVSPNIIVHWDLDRESKRTLNSLEGIFFSYIPLADEILPGSVNPEWELVIPRSEMKKLEEKYQGKFIPFEKKW